MDKNILKTTRRTRRKQGMRKRIFGTPIRPRLTVFRSNRNIYAQIIDDVAGKTLAAAGSGSDEKGSTREAASAVGAHLAEQAKAAGIETITFDRNGFHYHGRIKALADAARKGGLSF